MIIPLKKYLFVGLSKDLDAFFHRAQENGFLEFLSLSGKKMVEIPQKVQQFLDAIKILRRQHLTAISQEVKNLPDLFLLSREVIDRKQQIDKLEEEKRLLEQEIARVAVFGDFSKELIDEIERQGNRKIQFFCIKTAKSHKTNFGDELIYIGTEYDLDYFIAINSHSTNYPDMIEMRIDRPLGELQGRLLWVKETIRSDHETLKSLTPYIARLQEAVLESLNEYALIATKKQADLSLDAAVFLIEAWVPENKLHSLYGLIDGLAIHPEEIAISEGEKIPTCLNNKGCGKMGEDLIAIYDVPSATDKDPSLFVFFAFVLFFAIIVADAGYGFLFLAVALYMKYKFPVLKGQGKRMLKLFTILSVSCIVWGAITSAYFGIRIDPDHFLGKISVLDYLAAKKADYHIARHDDVYKDWIQTHPELANTPTGVDWVEKSISDNGKFDLLSEFSQNILMEFSLLLGIIHISISLLRWVRRNFSAIGWVLFMIGSYLYFPSFLKATVSLFFLGLITPETAAIVGLQLIYTGLGLAAFLALVQHRLRGLGEVPVTLIQIFADVLSYLRLYALALAGSMMAETFNNIGDILGLFIGLIALFIGHAVNLSLAVMGGVIHGLRLNFLEWYHYCFEGGGRLFNPLKKLK